MGLYCNSTTWLKKNFLNDAIALSGFRCKRLMRCTIAKLYMTNFQSFPLFYITQSFAIAATVTDSEIRQNLSHSF